MAYRIKTKSLQPKKTAEMRQVETMRSFLTSKGFRHAETMKYKTLKAHFEAVRK